MSVTVNKNFKNSKNGLNQYLNKWKITDLQKDNNTPVFFNTSE